MFQFHLVRLKETPTLGTTGIVPVSIPSGTVKRFANIGEQEVLIRFQFHLVRLKAFANIGEQEVLIRFQFHLARLKVFRCQRIIFILCVSIPSGTVKSVPFPLIIATNPVSIPSGTVKSACRQCKHQREARVSIPSGTVKSNPRYSKFIIGLMFQFHLVRLKVLKFVGSKLPPQCFNSIWYG